MTDTSEIRKAPNLFSANGYHYTLLQRNDVLALYEGHNKTGGLCFEVHKLRVLAGRTSKFRRPDGSIIVVTFPIRETLACNEDFGKYGWSYGKKENALRKFDELASGGAK